MRPWLRTALPAALIALAVLAPSTASAAPTSSIRATIGPVCELGGTTDPNLKLTVTHTTKSGVTKAVYKPQGDINGNWFTTCTPKGMRSGDKLIIKSRPDGTLLRTVTVPTLSMSVNRVADTVSGVVPTTGETGLTVTPCDSWNCQDGNGVVLTPDGQGRFAVAAPFAVDGRDLLLLDSLQDDDEWFLFQRAPSVTVIRGKAGVIGNAKKPGAKVTVTVTRGALVATFKGTAGPNGVFTGTLLRNGQKFRVATGDQVTASVATDATFLVPAGALTVGGGSVSGTCFPGELVVISSVAPDRSGSSTTHETADVGGAFSTAIQTPSGWVVTVQCDTGAGDTVTIVKPIP